ncbi:MAG: hypothetical protein ABEL04_12695 [Salinibacter sp.]|uniref:hypothetical protein n=1 Tax=Salinibacter sp. TaxID=2065818 RepID=UPI0035D49211
MGSASWRRLNWSIQFSGRVGVYLFGLVGTGVLIALLLLDQVRAAVAFTALVGLVAMAMMQMRLAIVAALVFLIVLGDLRRLLLPVAEWSGTDPLLVVGPAFALIATGYTWASGRLSFDTPAAKWMLAVMAIMLVQIFNPRQGGLIVGVAGIMFQLVPLLWFWLGRAYGHRDVLQTLLFRVVLGLSALAMLFGLYQSLVGYLPYQLEWYRTAGYIALGTPETGLAPITFFASSSEHNIFVNLGLILLWTLVLFRHWEALWPIPLFFGALLLTGSRGPVAKGLVTMAGLWAILGPSLKTWVLRGGLALIIAVGGLYLGLSGLTQRLSGAPKHIQAQIERQAAEFVHGSGSHQGSSTANHLGMLLYGYRLGLQRPLGHGLGAGTKAAKKFGNFGTTETDLGDSIRALGIPGGLAYHGLVFVLVLTGFRLWRRERSPLSMAFLGFMGIAFLAWLRGGHYAVTPLLWFCLGAMDRLWKQETVTE